MMIWANFTGQMRWATRPFMVAACAMAIAGCGTVARIPYTQQEQAEAVISGIPGARLWADNPAIATGRRSVVSRVPVKQPTVLALSGGGADGAFGAGLLTGWSARGTRPQFTFVTGASAGALIAPFAFLGAAHDETLRSVFASGEMANLLQSEGLGGLFGAGLFKTAPLRELIARHVDAGLLAAIAQEYRAGRRLYVVTTNLDAQRTAIWDMGKIAASGEPGALDLFRNVDRIGEHSGRIFACSHRCRSARTAFRGNACRWRRHNECAYLARGRAAVRHPGVSARCAAESLYRDERQAFAGFRSCEGLDAADRDTVV